MMSGMMMRVRARMIFSVCIQMQTFSRVPFLGAPLISCLSSHRRLREAVSCFLTEPFEHGVNEYVLDEITRAKQSPPNQPAPQSERTIPHSNRNSKLFPFPNGILHPFCSPFTYLRSTTVSCTPARPNAARVHVHTWYHLNFSG